MQDPVEYEAKLQQLNELLSLASDTYIDLFFADQSGFSLVPPISYHWQPKNQSINVVPIRSQRINVFGIMSEDNRLKHYSTTGSINSQFIIDSLDDFASRIRCQSVVCLDNARIHHTKTFRQKIKEWSDQGLMIFFLPKYSPHLNSIETLWRKMKYEWLKPLDYLSWDSLTTVVQHIMNTFGSTFRIDFN